MSRKYKIYVEISNKEHFQLDSISKTIEISDDCDQEEANDILLEAVWEMIQDYITFEWEEVK